MSTSRASITTLTPERLAELGEAYERIWRRRTPTTQISDIMARNRVTYSDLMDWYFTTYGEWLTPLDREPIAPVVAKVLKRLKREFPNERWD